MNRYCLEYTSDFGKEVPEEALKKAFGMVAKDCNVRLKYGYGQQDGIILTSEMSFKEAFLSFYGQITKNPEEFWEKTQLSIDLERKTNDFIEGRELDIKDSAAYHKQRYLHTEEDGGINEGGFLYGERWAKTAQGLMESGLPQDKAFLYGAWLATQNKGFSYLNATSAVSFLCSTWKHGEDLRIWWNNTFFSRENAEEFNGKGVIGYDVAYGDFQTVLEMRISEPATQASQSPFLELIATSPDLNSALSKIINDDEDHGNGEKSDSPPTSPIIFDGLNFS